MRAFILSALRVDLCGVDQKKFYSEYHLAILQIGIEFMWVALTV